LKEFFEDDHSPLTNEFKNDQAISGKRWPFHNFSAKEYLWHQRRKLIYALFNGTKSERVIKTEFEPVRAWQEIRGDFPSERVTSSGWVKMIARLVDDSQAAFMPSIYRIQPLNVLSGPSSASEVDCIVSFLEEFRLQAFKDEIVYAEGNLERVEGQNSSRHQITLTYCPRYYEQTFKAIASKRD
jgi:predicted nucleotidyltransferase